MPSQPPVLVFGRNPPQSVSTSAAYSVRRQMDSRVGSCKWHLKIAHGYESDSRVVPDLRGGLVQPPAQMRRGLRGQARREDQRGERILLVNRNDNLEIDPLRERASRSNSRRRASRGSRVTTARSGQSGTLVSITLRTALNCKRIPVAFGATRMLGNDSPGCNPGMSTALSVYNSVHCATKTKEKYERRYCALQFSNEKFIATDDSKAVNNNSICFGKLICNCKCSMVSILYYRRNQTFEEIEIHAYLTASCCRLIHMRATRRKEK